jgi:hypothetical protein
MTDARCHLIRRQHTRLLLIFILAYVISCLLLYWMSRPLFRQDIFFQQWPQPSLIEIAYLVYMSCLPVALWMVTFTVLAIQFPRLFSAPLVVTLVFVALAVIERDLIWHTKGECSTR